MTTENNISAYLQLCSRRVDTALGHCLPDQSVQPQRLHEAMRYAALGPGKRIRPVLVYAAGEALRVSPAQLDPCASAIELIHAYSLVHDDLPAMDDDDLRRGRPTCHRAFDQATAILAGDALQSLAFQLLAQQGNNALPAERRLEMIQILSIAAGSRGMAGGQALDMEATGNELDIAQLELMHIHKTGALIRACVQLAYLAAPESTSQQQQHLDRYAKCIGLAFQIRDDILDVEGNTELLGKTRGKDADANKATYTSLMGVDGAREKARELLAEALDNLAGFGGEAAHLRDLARYIVARTR